MKNQKEIEELTGRLNQLYDELEALQEEFYRFQEEGEMTNDIEFQMASCEIAIGELEEQLELLR